MSKIIDRALDIINDHLKTQSSELPPTMEVKQGLPGMAHGGYVLEDDYPTHYLPHVGRQVMADGGMPAGRPDISQYLQQIQAQQAPMRQAPVVSDYAYTGAARPQGYEPNRPSWVAPGEYVQSFQGGSPTPYVYGYEPPKPEPRPTPRAAPSGGGGGGIDPMQMMFLMRAMRGFAEGGMPDDDDPVARALQTAQSVSQEPMPDMTPRPTMPSVPSAEGRVTAPKRSIKGMRLNEESSAPPAPMGHNMPPEPMQPVGASMDMQGLHPQLISQRLPTAKKAGEDPNQQALLVGLDSAKMHPKSFEHNVELAKTYDHLRPEEMEGSHDDVAENFINHLKDNYLFLHDMMPEETRARAKEWYVGANKFSNQLAGRHGSDPAASAAAIAAMSPQKDWFQNASLAERLFDIHHNHGDEDYSHEMEMTANRIFGKEKFDELLNEVRGKKYNDIKDSRLKAIWARLYDETYHDPAHRLMTPEGVIGDWVTNQDGSRARVSWGSTAEILKGIEALQQGATRENISNLMGERHKIRNFYNNILDPHSPTQDVTVDTHAVAGGLLEPLGANATQVSHNFKNNVMDKSPASKGSAETGVQGTYPFYAEALRRAAAERGIEPREMQSITWEGLKGLFPDTFKTEKNIAAVREVWKDYAAGNIDIGDARKQIVKLAGGMNEPAWSGSAPISDEGAPHSTYERKLPKAGVYGGSASVEPRVGGADTSSVSGLGEQELRSFQRNRELTRASRQAFGQEALPQSFSRRTGRVGKNNVETGFEAPVRAVYDVTPEAQEAFKSAGISAPSMVELASGAKGANAFHSAITKSKETNPLAASVHAYDPKEYAGMRLFMTPNGKAGFALKGDDIVSVFNSKDSGHAHVSNAMLQLALAQGGRRLDAFDTALPHIYSRNKFRVASRMPWNEEYKPEGWKHSDFAAYNNGRPDVVFMHYDPTYDQLYDGAQGSTTNDYDRAVKLQDAGVKKAEGAIAKFSKKTAKAYGGAIAGPKLTEENAEDFARRLILWSYAAAPFVNRSIRRATGGEVDPSVDQALDTARGASQADPAASAMETARSLTPMGFYSAAAEAASKIPQRAPIDQILNKVKGSPGVKAEELDWSGVKDAFAGQRSVDPQEVARHFQASLPALQETVKADPEIIAQKLATQRQSLLMQGKKDEADALMDQIKKVYDPSWKSENAAKYGKYTLPDGRNYREVLLHLPNEEGDLYKQISQARQDRIDAVREHGSVLKYDDPALEQERLQKIREATQRENDLREKLKNVRKGQSYKSSHWNVPDVVAHLRLSDRDMGKTLHMEELQSDWGQEGRDEGFNDPKAEARRKELYDLINKVKGDRAEETNKVHSEFKENSKEFNSAYDDLIKDEHKIFVSSKFNQRDVDRYNEATDAALEKTKHLLEPAEKEKQKSLLAIDQKYGPLIEKIEREFNSLPKASSDSPPSAPHVTSSEGWTDLGLKRALQEAAKGGYNKLVWTPGQAQADRYDLSQQVKHIMWSPDNKILSALTHDGYDAVGKQVEKEDLHKYIGKEAAKKLLDQEPEIDGNMATHHLRGQDISVGAEGMKNYYDRFVPKRLGKLVSSLDPNAKIEMHAHPLPDTEEGETVMGHVLHITPKLRAAILKGLPAYKQGGFATNSAPIVNKALEVVSGLRR